MKEVDAEQGRCSFCDTEQVVAISEASGWKVAICEGCLLWAQEQIREWLKRTGILTGKP